jgi:hypothetical protein
MLQGLLPLTLPALEAQLLVLLAVLVALNLLIWHCNKGMLTAVYDAPQDFYLQLPKDSSAPAAKRSDR